MSSRFDSDYERLLLLVGAGHEAGEDGHHHLGLDFRQILRQGVGAGTDLTAHRDGILGVGHAVLR